MQTDENICVSISVSETDEKRWVLDTIKTEKTTYEAFTKNGENEVKAK